MQTKRARQLRRHATVTEQRLWRALREADLPVKVRRQHPIGPNIADIAIPACKLVIELDGGQHALNVETDASRTREIERQGYRVIRFWNNDVSDNIDGVVATIVAAIGKTPTSP